MSRPLSLIPIAVLTLTAPSLTAQQPNIWTVTGKMGSPRLFHTATLLPSGRVLVTGGRPKVYETLGLNSAEIYDPTNGIWSAAASMSTLRNQHTASLLADGRVLVIGGCIGDDFDCIPLRSAEVYNPATNQWSGVANMTLPRFGHEATTLPNGEILVTGGAAELCCDASPTATIFSPATGLWRPAASMRHARFAHTATLLVDGRVLVAGGSDSSLLHVGLALPGAEIYDPVTDQWQSTFGMNGYAKSSATRLSDGKVLVAGGEVDFYTVVKETWIFDPQAGQWTAGPPLNTERSYHQANLLSSGNVLFSSGRNLSTYEIRISELYIAATGRMVKAGDQIQGRRAHTATVLMDGRVLVAGGANASHAGLDSAEVFTPGSSPFLRLSTTSVNFGQVELGVTTDPQPIRIFNDGDLALTISQASIAGPNASEFQLLGSCPSVAPGGECTLQVTFTPRSYDSKTARLQLVSNAPTSPDVVDLAGSGFLATSEYWLPAGVMHGWRPRGSVTAFRPGKILITGGATADVYDFFAGTTTQTPPSPSPHADGHAAVLLSDGKVLVTGGFTAAADIYNPATNTWSSAPPMNSTRSFHTATRLAGGKVLVAGGGTAAPELYDPNTNSWTSMGPMVQNRSYHSATLLYNGKVLFAFGIRVGGSRIYTAELFNPVTGTWQLGPLPPRQRFSHTATRLLDGRVLIAGGETSTVDIYHPMTNSWSRAPDMLTGRGNHSASLLANGRVLVVGGITGCHIDVGCFSTEGAEIYDPVLRRWTRTANAYGNRWGHATAPLPGGLIFVAGGNTEYGFLSMPVLLTEIYTGPRAP